VVDRPGVARAPLLYLVAAEHMHTIPLAEVPAGTLVVAAKAAHTECLADAIRVLLGESEAARGLVLASVRVAVSASAVPSAGHAPARSLLLGLSCADPRCSLADAANAAASVLSHLRAFRSSHYVLSLDSSPVT
jgi:hypothetical protein